jgi:hypothetical protein
VEVRDSVERSGEFGERDVQVHVGRDVARNLRVEAREGENTPSEVRVTAMSAA